MCVKLNTSMLNLMSICLLCSDSSCLICKSQRRCLLSLSLPFFIQCSPNEPLMRPIDLFIHLFFWTTGIRGSNSSSSRDSLSLSSSSSSFFIDGTRFTRCQSSERNNLLVTLTVCILHRSKQNKPSD